MPLTEKDIYHLADLARLNIDAASIASTVRDLSNILGLVKQMEAAKAEDLPPMAHPLDLPQPLRLDVVTEPDQREGFQAIAPKVEAGLYLVPRVIGEEG